MTNELRPRIEAALAATADRLNPGSGGDAVRHAKNDLSVIGATEANLNARYAGQDVRIAAPAIFEVKHADGDPVTIRKKHEGLIVVFADSFIYVRGMGFGARDVKALGKGEVTVERVTTVLEGSEVPGLRITGRNGKPKFALAIALPKTPGDPAGQAAVRDEIYDLLTS